MNKGDPVICSQCHATAMIAKRDLEAGDMVLDNFTKPDGSEYGPGDAIVCPGCSLPIRSVYASGDAYPWR